MKLLLSSIVLLNACTPLGLKFALPAPTNTPTIAPTLMNTATFSPTATIPTETLIPQPTVTNTPQPTEIIISFPQNLSNHSEGISFQMSASAKKFADVIFGKTIESISIDPAALSQIRVDFINYVSAIYTDYEHVALSGKIWFLEPGNGEWHWNGSQFIVNTNPEKCWDTSETLNLFAVTSVELEKIKEGLGDNPPNAPKYAYAWRPISEGGTVLIYNDETGATNAYSSIDFYTKEFISKRATQCPLCSTLSSNVRVSVMVFSPITGMSRMAEKIAISFGRNVGFTITNNWTFNDLGCDEPDSNNYMANCSAVIIK